MAKQIVLGEESRRAIQHGVDILADAVRVTIGPRGRNVVLENKYGYPRPRSKRALSRAAGWRSSARSRRSTRLSLGKKTSN